MANLEEMLSKIKEDKHCNDIKKNIVIAFDEVKDVCEEAIDKCETTLDKCDTTLEKCDETIIICDDVTEKTKLLPTYEAKMSQLSSDFNSAVANVTNGNESVTNSEIVLARKGKSSLREKIDDIEENQIDIILDELSQEGISDNVHSNLNTSNKTIIGGINEVNAQLQTIEQRLDNLDVGGIGESNISIRKSITNEIFILDEELPNTFTVTNNLTNATNSNSLSNVTEGNSYTATISANTNYVISSIVITMNGVNITSSVVTGNTINIPNVTGNVVITVITTSTLIPATGITLNKSTLSFTDKTTQTLIATVTPTNTDDPVIWHSSNTSVATVVGGVVTPIKTGNCVITATCGSKSATCNVTITLPLQSFTITNNLTNCTSNNSSTSIQEGNSYNATITATSDYSISSTVITMGGVNITNTSYSNGVISISQVTGNIVITITAIKVVNVVTDGLIKSLYDVTSTETIDNANKTYLNVNNEEFTVFAKCTITTDTTNYATTLGGSAHPLTMQIAWNGQIGMTLQVTDGTTTTYPTFSSPPSIDTTSYDQVGESVFIAFVGNKSNIKCYINNVLKSGTVDFDSKTYTPPTSIKVGDTNKKVTWLYYNRVLTAEELTQNYTALGGVV